MVTLLLTCLLTTGTVFIPPDDWKIEKISVGGKPAIALQYLLPATCHLRGVTLGCPEPDTRTRIFLSRILHLGDTVQAPEGCTVEMRRE